MTGLGIESTSFRNGLPHESVLEMDVLTGSGEIVTPDAGASTPTCSAASPTPTARSATPPGCASSSSRSAVVALRHVRFHDLETLVAAMGASSTTGEHDGEPVDYLDGVVFSATESYLTLGRAATAPGRPATTPVSRSTTARSSTTARPDRPAHHPRLPVALGHRLVLVQPGLRRAAPPRAPALAASAAAAARLLEAHRASTTASPSPTGSRRARAGRRASGWCRTSRCPRAAPPSSSTGSCARCRSSRSGCARCGCAARSLDPLPAAARGDLRQRGLLVHGRRRPGRAAGCRPTGSSRRRSPPWAATSPCTPTSSTTRRSSGGSTAATRTPRSSSAWDPDGRLLDLYSKAVRRRLTTPQDHHGPIAPREEDPDVDRRDRRGGRRRRGAAALHRLRRARAGAARRDLGPCTCRPRGAPLPRDRARRAGAGPGLRRGRPRRSRACTPATPTTCSSTSPTSLPAPPPAAAVESARTLGVKGLTPPPPPPQEALPRWRRVAEGLRHSHDPRRRGDHHHYDVSNRFYEMVLGPSMTYTCACYPDAGGHPRAGPGEQVPPGLRQARPQPGDRLLDIGCGWGGMVRYAARHGVQVLGVTLSRQQALWAQKAIADDGLGRPRRGAPLRLPRHHRDRVRRRVVDRAHRAHRGAQLPGLLPLDPRPAAPRRAAAQPLHHPARTTARQETGHFIDRYVFPDGELTGSGRDHHRRRRTSASRCVHEENLREHYALTLAAVVPQPRRATGTSASPRSARAPPGSGACTWRGRDSGFERNEIQLHQVLAVRPHDDGTSGLPLRPWWSA